MVLRSLLWSVSVHIVLVTGLLALGWAPGNVVLLLWLDAVTTVIAAVVQARTAGGHGLPPNIRRFLFWALPLLVILLLICSALGFMLGVDFGVAQWFLPALLLIAARGAELITGWFNSGESLTTLPEDPLTQVLPRLLSVIALGLMAFVVANGHLTSRSSTGSGSGQSMLDRIAEVVDLVGISINPGQVLVFMLVMARVVTDAFWINRRSL